MKGERVSAVRARLASARPLFSLGIVAMAIVANGVQAREDDESEDLHEGHRSYAAVSKPGGPASATR